MTLPRRSRSRHPHARRHRRCLPSSFAAALAATCALATAATALGAQGALGAPGPLAADTVTVAPGRVRLRALGVAPGVFAPGRWNAITDVAGVRVGHATVVEGDSVRTGVTAILPHGGDLFRERVPAAVVVGNGFGKLLGSTQVSELGELETPVLLTCTLCVWQAADALVAWQLARPGMERVRSINPVVAETNDGTLNAAIRSRPVHAGHVRAALDGAREGAVPLGSVGAGTGTVAFGWKGGIGSSSRVLPRALGAWTVGVLVQSNFGGVLRIGGAPVGEALGRHPFVRALADSGAGAGAGAPASPALWSDATADGSIVIVVATDAPLSDRNLRRLAARALLGLGRTGSYASNGSGDYVIAFSTASTVRRAADAPRLATTELSNGEELSGLFAATADATEEAIHDSILTATTVTSRGGTVEAIPLGRVRAVLQGRGEGRKKGAGGDGPGG